jgi:hypothetical protein
MSKEMTEYLITFVCLGNSYRNTLYHPDKDLTGIMSGRFLHPSSMDETEVGARIKECMRKAGRDLPGIMRLMTKEHGFVDANAPPEEKYITSYTKEFQFAVPINMPREKEEESAHEEDAGDKEDSRGPSLDNIFGY